MRRSFRLSLNSRMANRSYGMTRRTISPTLESNSSRSSVSDVMADTSSMKSSRSLRSRNRTGDLTRAILTCGGLDDAHAGAGPDARGAGRHHGFQFVERADSARGFDAHIRTHS